MSEFQNKVVVITGGAQGIGRCTAEMFRKEGAKVCVIDIQEKPQDLEVDLYYKGDISREDVLRNFADLVLKEYSHIDYLVNNAVPLFKGINECTFDEFNYALRVGVTAPFMLTKLFMESFGKGAAIVNISSSRDRMSQPQSESYTAAKGGIAALTHALAVSLSGKVRVNSISPGWIETRGAVYDGADVSQHPAGRVGKPEDIANVVLFLCSERAGFITGENICVDGGMTKLMIYHDDHGWKYEG